MWHIEHKHGTNALKRLPHVLLRGKRSPWEESKKEKGIFKRTFSLHGERVVIGRKAGKSTPIVITSFEQEEKSEPASR